MIPMKTTGPFIHFQTPNGRYDCSFILTFLNGQPPKMSSAPLTKELTQIERKSISRCPGRPYRRPNSKGRLEKRRERAETQIRDRPSARRVSVGSVV